MAINFSISGRYFLFKNRFSIIQRTARFIRKVSGKLKNMETQTYSGILCGIIRFNVWLCLMFIWYSNKTIISYQLGHKSWLWAYTQPKRCISTSSQTTVKMYDPLPVLRRELCGLLTSAWDDGISMPVTNIKQYNLQFFIN